MDGNTEYRIVVYENGLSTGPKEIKTKDVFKAVEFVNSMSGIFDIYIDGLEWQIGIEKSEAERLMIMNMNLDGMNECDVYTSDDGIERFLLSEARLVYDGLNYDIVLNGWYEVRYDGDGSYRDVSWKMDTFKQWAKENVVRRQCVGPRPLIIKTSKKVE